jgi:hypothetical protein
MREGIRRFVYFALVVAAIIVVLQVLNRLPLLQQGTLRTYPSVEAMRSKLNLRDLRVPAYFPQDVAWPPAEIWAQTRPYAASLMVFRRRDGGGTALVVSQAAAGRAPLDERIKILRVREAVPYDLKGKKALLTVGVCGQDAVCSRISWNEGAYEMTVAMSSPPFELIKIAESMAK